MNGSLRTRLTIGALVWMTAVLIVVIAVVVRLTRNHPEMAMRHATHITMGILAGASVVGGLFLVRKAVAPFGTLRTGLSSVREGRSRRIEGDYPSEVQPLVNDLNALLEDRERAIARALTTAGDLAHGLKTPLAVLAQEAEQTGAAGHDELAATLRQLVERMQRQIDYHLARARATASARAAPGLRCPVLPSVEGLVRTMRRLHAERELTIDADVSPAHEIRGRREDLEEMLGNLLDNACKWARSRVAISSFADDTRVVVSVDDDGPGLDPSMRAQVLQRGVRADQQVGGSGLGLAIVSELAELYGGSVILDTSPLGGTRARLELPRLLTKFDGTGVEIE
jgi:signal transduction histidine kinase